MSNNSGSNPAGFLLTIPIYMVIVGVPVMFITSGPLGWIWAAIWWLFWGSVVGVVVYQRQPHHRSVKRPRPDKGVW